MIVIQLLACVGTVVGFGGAVLGFGGLLGEALAHARHALPMLLPAAAPRRAPAAPRAKAVPKRIVVSPAWSTSAHCPVCAQGLKGEVLMCPRCQALSHEDCWSY